MISIKEWFGDGVTTGKEALDNCVALLASTDNSRQLKREKKRANDVFWEKLSLSGEGHQFWR